MGGRMSRNKGAGAEREFAALVSEALGVEVKRKLGQAREGGDDSCVAPRWGESGEVVLRAYLDARAMAGLAADRERRLEMGRASVERIARFTPGSWASAMRAAIVGRAA